MPGCPACSTCSACSPCSSVLPAGSTGAAPGTLPAVRLPLPAYGTAGLGTRPACPVPRGPGCVPHVAVPCSAATAPCTCAGPGMPSYPGTPACTAACSTCSTGCTACRHVPCPFTPLLALQRRATGCAGAAGAAVAVALRALRAAGTLPVPCAAPLP